MSRRVEEVIKLAEQIEREYLKAAEEHARKLQALRAELEELAAKYAVSPPNSGTTSGDGSP